MGTDEKFLGTKSAAAKLGLSVEMVRVLARSGRLPSIQLPSGQRVFRSDDVSALAYERAIAEGERMEHVG